MPQLNAVGIVVSDMERSIRFYRLLGLEFPTAPAEHGHQHLSKSDHHEIAKRPRRHGHHGMRDHQAQQ